MTFTWCALIVSLLLSPLAAQKVDLKLDELKSKAKETEEQNLEGAELESFLNTQLTALEAAARASRDAKQAEKSTTLDKTVEQLRRVAPLLTGVYLRTYEFSKAGAYADADLEPVFRQVQREDWSHLLSTKDREDRIDVFLMSRGGQAVGMLLVVAEPDEIVVINVVGKAPLAEAKEMVSSHIRYDLTAPATPKK
jgi:hypothetical protein